MLTRARWRGVLSFETVSLALSRISFIVPLIKTTFYTTPSPNFLEPQPLTDALPDSVMLKVDWSEQFLQWTPDGRHNRALERLGISHVRGTHMLRKTSATLANEVTGDFYAVSRLMDHPVKRLIFGEPVPDLIPVFNSH